MERTACPQHCTRKCSLLCLDAFSRGMQYVNDERHCLHAQCNCTRTFRVCTRKHCCAKRAIQCLDEEMLCLFARVDPVFTVCLQEVLSKKCIVWPRKCSVGATALLRTAHLKGSSLVHHNSFPSNTVPRATRLSPHDTFSWSASTRPCRLHEEKHEECGFCAEQVCVCTRARKYSG